MGKLLRILKVVGGIAVKAAPVAAQLAGAPAVGLVVQEVLQAVLTSEVDGASSDEKKLQAMRFIAYSTPRLLRELERDAGTPLEVDEHKYAEAMSQMTDAVVSLLNSVNAIPKGSKGSDA